MLTDDFLVHGREYEPVEPEQKPWYTNLVQVGPQEGQEMDEMAIMRLEAEKWRGGEEGRPDVPPKETKESEKKKDKKRKEVDDKERKKRKESSAESSELGAGQKELSALYAGTALDPAPKVRNRILKKARKMGRGRKKKKRRPSSSSKGGSTSSSSSSSGRFEHGGLFSSEKKMKVIWERYPGALAASSLMDAQEVLLTDSGTMWDADRKQMPPLATQFVRQHLAANMSAPMYQEALTLSSCIDNLLLGHPATTCDILFQRLKALENVSEGSHWTVGRQLELVRSDQTTLTNEVEGLEAARRAREEERLRSALARPSGGRAGDTGGFGKRKKGKDSSSKGAAKGGTEDGRRGKGNDPKKENKGGWQKGDK